MQIARPAGCNISQRKELIIFARGQYTLPCDYNQHAIV